MSGITKGGNYIVQSTTGDALLEACLLCGQAAICGCPQRHTRKGLESRTSGYLSQLLRDCYEGPLSEERELRMTICQILLDRETGQMG